MTDREYRLALKAIRSYIETSVSSYDPGYQALYDACERYAFPQPEDLDNPALESESTSPYAQAEQRISRVRPTSQEVALADQLWLIGRRCPPPVQRYHYRNSFVRPTEQYLPDKEHGSFYGDIALLLMRGPEKDGSIPVGYLRDCAVPLTEDRDVLYDGDFFDYLRMQSVRNACYLLRKEYRKSFFLRFYKLYGKNPWVTSQKSLIDTTAQTTKLIAQFTQLIMSARLLRDAAILKESSIILKDPIQRAQISADLTNWKEVLNDWRDTIQKGKQSICISFSSKLLHFQCPERFFLFDSVSSNMTTGQNGMTMRIPTRKHPEGFQIILSFDKTWTNEVVRNVNYVSALPKISMRGDEETLQRYFDHAAKELALSQLITDAMDGEPLSWPLTRLTDLLVTKASK